MDAEQGLNIVEKVWRFFEAKMGYGNPDDVDDNNSVLLPKILNLSNLNIISPGGLYDHFLPEVGDAEDSSNLWTPLATHLMRLYRDLPNNILPDEPPERRVRLAHGGYVVCSGATVGKTHAAIWLMKKLKSLPEERRPRGFMVTGNGRRANEAYASFVARSFRVAGNIDLLRLVNLIVTALLHESTGAKR
jgi:hypothetical protein